MRLLLVPSLALIVVASRAPPLSNSIFVPRQNVSIIPRVHVRSLPVAQILPSVSPKLLPSLDVTTAASVVGKAAAATALTPPLPLPSLLANSFNRSQVNATTTMTTTTTAASAIVDDTEDLELGNEELRLTEKQLENNIFDSMQNLHKLEDRLNRQMKDLERRLNLAADIIRKRTNESHSMSTKILKDISAHVVNLDTRSDRVQQLLSNASSIYYDNVRDLLNNETEKIRTEMRQAEKMRTESRQTIESQLRAIGDKILERVNATAEKCGGGGGKSDSTVVHFPDTRSYNTAGSTPPNNNGSSSNSNNNNSTDKANRDIDLLSNLDLQIMTKIDLTGKSKLVSLTPLMLAKRMRDMMNELWNKQGMVSVCYHNEPRAFTADHPLAPNDPDYVRLFFNGTMDAVHAPDKGINLNVPNYINALILELKNTNRDHVSLCIEANAADSKHENWAKCLNMIVKKKKK